MAASPSAATQSLSVYAGYLVAYPSPDSGSTIRATKLPGALPLFALLRAEAMLWLSERKPTDYAFAGTLPGEGGRFAA